MTLPCFSKVGSATIAALARGVNTLLTATTMGRKKFHLTVTIDNEKVLQIADFLDFSSKNSKRAKMNPRSPIRMNKISLWMPRHGFLALQFYCHVQPLKVARLSDFYPPTYVSTLPA